MLVERLVDAGYTVLPVNPDLIARRRGPARNKDDAEDARIACLLALDRYASLRPLIPHGELADRPDPGCGTPPRTGRLRPSGPPRLAQAPGRPGRRGAGQRPVHPAGLPGPRQGRFDPTWRHPTAGHRRPASHLATPHGRAAAGRPSTRTRQHPTRGPVGAGVPWRQGLPELSRPW